MDLKLDKYIEEHSPPEDELLKELSRETHLKILQPRMLSGNLQGQLLTMFMQMINPKVVLEIGTLTGYSAICMAKGMQQNSILHTIEINDELENVARKYFQKSKLTNIKQHIGDALEIIETIENNIDFVFIDGNKRHYCQYYNAVFNKLSSGGYILADNILWDGKVIEKLEKKDPQTRGILEFNKMIASDDRVTQVILPIRDGLMLIRKK